MVSPEKIIGRFQEQKILEKLFCSAKAEFLAVYGRRRVGKTFLIRNFFKKKNCYFFNSTGIHKESIRHQIKAFTKEIGNTFYNGAEIKEKDTWLDTFELLSVALNKGLTKNKKIVLFFDEFPWMYTHRSKLLQALDYYWNRYWSQDKRVKLIICGSAASWIINNITNNKAGLHNRITQTIQLEPMNLRDAKDYLENIGVKINYIHVTQVYMATGGIPYYLSHITPGSSAQIIENIAFAKNSFLLKEFDNLYSSLFDNSEIYVQLVRIIAQKRYGIAQEDLFRQTKTLSKGGTIVNKLKELENAGFISSFLPFEHHKKGVYYRVIDEYSLFYFNWIEPLKHTLLHKGLRKGYWQNIQNSPAWYSWSGCAFEAICYKHLPQISEALNMSPTAIPVTWRYSPQKMSSEKGVQIDLLFDRNDDAITICEIKYTQEPFAIDKQYAEKLKQKIAVFTKMTRCKKQIFLSFVSANGLKKNVYTNMISQIITLEDFFKKLS